MEVISRSLTEREQSIDRTLGRLAYQRLKLQKEVEELDRQIAYFEGMADHNRMCVKDLETEKTISVAKEEQKEEA